MYDGENTMLLTGPEFTGGLTEDEDQLPKSWDDTWDRDELANAVFNVGDLWLKEMKWQDEERVLNRLADYLGCALLGRDFPYEPEYALKYRAACSALVYGMRADSGYDTEDMIWKWLARMFRDDDFDSSNEESAFFDWFKKKYEDESWSWVRRTQHIETELKV